jgi:hypothetical protein
VERVWFAYGGPQGGPDAWMQAGQQPVNGPQHDRDQAADQQPQGDRHGHANANGGQGDKQNGEGCGERGKTGHLP